MRSADIVILGGSAAGLSAALYAARRGLSVVVISKDWGGQLASTVDVENYPGILFTEGYTLTDTMAEQAKAAGAVLITDEITSLEEVEGEHRPLFIAKGRHNDYGGPALILALGKTPRGLGLEREQEFLGRGIEYCAPTRIKAARGQHAVVVGGGSTAFAAALLGAQHAHHVTVVHWSDKFRAEAAVISAVRAYPNVTLLTHTQVKKLYGHDKLSEVTLQHIDPATAEQQESKIKCDFLLIGAGFVINPALFSALVETNELGQVKVNVRQETSRPGIFAAGDITDVPYNQAVISAGEGAKAALSAYTYVTGRLAGADWGSA